METIGETFDVLGKILVAFAALRVHHRVLNEHKIDDRVFRIMKKEQILGILGVVFIVIGYFINVFL